MDTASSNPAPSDSVNKEIDDSKIETKDEITPFLQSFASVVDTIKKTKKKKQLEFLESLPGKLKRFPKQRVAKEKKPKKQRPKKEKKEKKPKKKKEPRERKPRPPPRVREVRTYPNVITSGISRDRGINDSFKNRAGIDPRISAKDVYMEDIGRGGGAFVKQDQRRYKYNDWNDAKSHQTKDWHHIIWLDPSAPAAIIHPADSFLQDNVKILKGKCPSKVNFGKEFGTDVEFIYMSPPWDSPNFGNGKRGYFTIDHLEKMEFKTCQARGFIFMWLPFEQMVEITKIMFKKGYTLVDSCGAMLSDFHGGVLTTQRNPNANKKSSNPEDLVGRMAGMSLKGVLWKLTQGPASKERFRIGNQIIYDAFQWRKKTDQYTGQFLPDHGYGYELYQYLMVKKPPEEEKKIHALHLWCRPGLQVKNFGGVEYFPEYDYKKGCLKGTKI